MFAQPAALLFLVTKTLWDGKPLQRLFEFALVRRDDARQRWRQFRPQRDFAFAFVGKIEKLRDDFRAAFLSVKIGRLEDRAVPFDKPIAPRDFAPAVENVVSKRAIFGQKIAKAGKWLHQSELRYGKVAASMQPRVMQDAKYWCG